ncbi:MAG: NAD(P)-dependent oxidoreductase [Flavobacteriales bacterium]
MKILFVDKVHPNLKTFLESKNFYCEEAYNYQREKLLKIVPSFHGIVIRSRIKLDDEFLSYCHQLKFIARAGSGMENIDEVTAKQKKIHLFNAPEGNRQAVAEHALAMLLSLFNKLNQADNEVRKGIWQREKNRGIELHNKTIAIIGYGNNGSAFAKVLSGFGCRVLAYDKYKKIESPYAQQVDMNQIFNDADILSLHIPLSNETTYLVDDDFINKFKNPIYLINTARGKCVDSSALLNGLLNNTILGACLDVHEFEKTSFDRDKKQIQKFDELLNHPNTIFSPHVAGWTKESNEKIAEVLFQKIQTIF